MFVKLWNKGRCGALLEEVHHLCWLWKFITSFHLQLHVWKWSLKLPALSASHCHAHSPPASMDSPETKLEYSCIRLKEARQDPSILFPDIYPRKVKTNSVLYNYLHRVFCLICFSYFLQTGEAWSIQMESYTSQRTDYLTLCLYFWGILVKVVKKTTQWVLETLKPELGCKGETRVGVQRCELWL